jgi:arabinogalactan endo-1,4-beta-galactosidase
LALKNLVQQSASAIGFCYWELVWVGFRGPTTTNGSPWENQALWDFGTTSLSGLAFFTKY